MLKKRLIGVVTIKDGWAVQSFGFRRYLPLGKPECLVENLDRWGADEILLQVIDRSIRKQGPDFDLLERIGSQGLSTPLIYAGGIRSLSDGINLIHMGADRLVVDALLHDDLKVVESLSEQLGSQALIASLPLTWYEDKLTWFDYRNQQSTQLTQQLSDSIQKGIVSETLVTDWLHEGLSGQFNQKLLQHFPLSEVPLILFGGITETALMKQLYQNPRVSAVAVGNSLSYREHAIQQFKEALVGNPLRPASYESRFSLLTHD